MKKNTIIAFSILLFFGIISVLDLFHPGFPVTHDTQDHIARIANFYQNLLQGNFIPRWAGNLNYGYGHPILEFLYPLPSYIVSLLHFIGFSLVDATKIVYGFGMITSGLTMYLFIRAMWGEEAGVIGGILYMYAPYKFVDLYVRGDIGENTAFVFLPLVFWGIYKLSKTHKKRYVLLSSLFLALLILSHNAVSLMMMPLILCFMLYLWWIEKWNKKFFVQSALVISFGFLLSSFFCFPALFEGQYTLRNIVTRGGYLTKFVNIQSLLYGPWSYSSWDIAGKNNLTVQLGILQWIFLVLSSVLCIPLWKRKKQLAVLIVGSIGTTLTALFLMLSQSNFIWQRTMLLQNFQFPWRFLSIPVFTLAMLGGLLVGTFPSIWRKIAVVTVLIAIFFLSKDYMHAKAYDVKPVSFFTGIYNGTTDTGESAPIWSVRFMEHRPKAPIQAIAGRAKILSIKRKITDHTYVVKDDTQVQFVENTLYFPGWRVLVDDKPVDVQFQDPHHRGLMTFLAPQGEHAIEVVYSESKLRLLGDVLSIVGLLGYLLFWIVSLQKKLL